MRDTAALRMWVNRKVTEHSVGAPSRMSRNRNDNGCSACGMGAEQPSVGQVLSKRRQLRMMKKWEAGEGCKERVAERPRESS